MKQETIYRHDPNLLVKAKAVFGDTLVTDAFVCTRAHEWEHALDDAIKRLDREMHQSAELDAEGGFSYDAQCIRLEFCNGRKVDFDNSEWAWISNPEAED